MDDTAPRPARARTRARRTPRSQARPAGAGGAQPGGHRRHPVADLRAAARSRAVRSHLRAVGSSPAPSARWPLQISRGRAAAGAHLAGRSWTCAAGCGRRSRGTLCRPCRRRRWAGRRSRPSSSRARTASPYGQVTAIMLFTMVMDQMWFATAIVSCTYRRSGCPSSRPVWARPASVRSRRTWAGCSSTSPFSPTRRFSGPRSLERLANRSCASSGCGASRAPSGARRGGCGRQARMLHRQSLSVLPHRRRLHAPLLDVALRHPVFRRAQLLARLPSSFALRDPLGRAVARGAGDADARRRGRHRGARRPVPRPAPALRLCRAGPPRVAPLTYHFVLGSACSWRRRVLKR